MLSSFIDTLGKAPVLVSRDARSDSRALNFVLRDVPQQWRL